MEVPLGQPDAGWEMSEQAVSWKPGSASIMLSYSHTHFEGGKSHSKKLNLLAVLFI